MKNNNPFFHDYKTVYQTIPFDKIKNEHYIPAFEEGFRLLKEETDNIASNPQKPTFENTIVALETSGQFLKRVSNAFFGIFSAVTDDVKMEIAQTISPKIDRRVNIMFSLTNRCLNGLKRFMPRKKS